MLEKFHKLAQGQLSAAITPIYTQASGKTSITNILLHNTYNSPVTVDIYYVPNSGGAVGSADDTNKIYSLELNTGESKILDFSKVGLILENLNDTIQAAANTASVINYILFGVIE